MMGTWAMIHHALQRCGHNPPPLAEFVELLDEIEEVEPTGEAAEVVPTLPVPGEDVLSR